MINPTNQQDDARQRVPTDSSQHEVSVGQVRATSSTTLYQTAMEPLVVVCPRCGKTSKGTLSKCPFCEARLSTPVGPGGQSASTAAGSVARFDGLASGKAISRMLLFYMVILAMNLVGHWIAEGMIDAKQQSKRLRHTELMILMTLEGIDTLVVLAALAIVPWPPALDVNLPGGRTMGWVMAGPIFLAVLGLNFGYHAILRNYVQFPHWAEDRLRLPMGWSIVLVCMQPGVVEELFFRFIALGTLSRVTTVAGAVDPPSRRCWCPCQFEALSVHRLLAVAPIHRRPNFRGIRGKANPASYASIRETPANMVQQGARRNLALRLRRRAGNHRRSRVGAGTRILWISHAGNSGIFRSRSIYGDAGFT